MSHQNRRVTARDFHDGPLKLLTDEEFLEEVRSLLNSMMDPLKEPPNGGQRIFVLPQAIQGELYRCGVRATVGAIERALDAIFAEPGWFCVKGKPAWVVWKEQRQW